MIDARCAVRDGYVVNSLGYRAPEFNAVNWSDSYILQGCSATFGIGITDDSQTVSANLEKMLNAPVINLGVAGSSIQFQCMNAVEIIASGIRPKGVFTIWPGADRYSYLGNNNIIHVGPWSENKFLSWMLDDNSANQNVHYAKTYKLLWELATVPVYDVTHHYSNCIRGICDTYVGEFKDWGTDGQHWGPMMAEHVALLLFQKHQLNL